MDISDWASWEERFAAFNQRNTAVADAAHDPEHIRRVVQNAKRLAQREGGALAVTYLTISTASCSRWPTK